jgi:hypothetical protein
MPILISIGKHYICKKTTAMSTVGAIQEGRLKKVQRTGKVPKKISWEAFQKNT